MPHMEVRNYERQVEMNWSTRLKLAATGILSGLIVGIPASLVTRLNMAAIALKVGENPTITLATLGIVETVLRESIIAGLIYVSIRRYLPDRNDIIRGLSFGLVLMLLFSIFFLLPPPPELVEAPLPAIGLFTLLSLVFGIAMAKTVRLLEHHFPTPRFRPAYVAVAYAPILFLGVFSGILFVVSDLFPLVSSGFRLVWMCIIT
jgi:hypothetical protein